MITEAQIQAIRDEAQHWTEQGDTYARGQAAGLLRALRILGVHDDS